jgi:hypothetical protein
MPIKNLKQTFLSKSNLHRRWTPRFIKTFAVQLFFFCFFLILFGYFLTFTILYPYWTEGLDNFLILMSLTWGLASFVHLVWLVMLSLSHKTPERALLQGGLSVCGMGLAGLSMFIMVAQTYTSHKLVKVETVGNKTFYVYDASFLDIACRVDVQNGIFLKAFYPVDPGCDPQAVHFIVKGQDIQIQLGQGH